MNKYCVGIMNKLPTHETVPIGQAASFLGVSIDTLRRWDKLGKITSTRINGKNRYFKISDLEEIKSRSQEKLSISEAAKTLGVSPSTLRRYEKKGFIKPEREGKGDRVYSKKTLNSFQKPQQEGVSFSKEMPISHQVIRQSKREKKWQNPSSFIVVVLLLTTILSTLYVRDQYEINQQKISSTTSRVLGAKDSGGILGFFGRVTGFFNNTNKRLVEQYKLAFGVGGIVNINEVFEYDDKGNLVPKVAINITRPELLKIKETVVIQNLDAESLQGRMFGEDEGDLAYFSSGGRITALKISALNILSGAVSGGVGGIILDSSITSEDLADDAVSSSEILNATIVNADIADGAINSAKIEDGTITTSDISDNTIDASDLADTITFADGNLLNLSAIDYSTNSIMGLILPNVSSASPTSPSTGEGYLAYDTAGDQVLVYDGSSWTGIGGSITLYTGSSDTSTSSSASGLELTSEELSLIRGCADTQVLKWNETSKTWQCGDDSGAAGAGISTVEENNVAVVTSATSIDFSGDFTVTDAGGGEADIALDYTNSGVTRKNQTQTVSGAWTFDNITMADNNIGFTGGNVTFDITGAATRTLTLLNSTASQVANLDLSDGVLKTGGTTRLTNAGVLQNITGLTVTGDITANDSDADTILIGQSGATDDVVTIAGNVSITDDNWSISATGVTTGLSGITAADLSCTNCIGPTEISDLTLGTDTAGNYIDNVTGGSGLSVTGSAGEGWEPAVALGALTANWDQTGAFDIVLNNASSEIQILESTGGTYFATFDVGDLSANATYTFSGTTGTVLTGANYSGTLDSIYVNVGESPSAGDISGSFSGGLTIGSGAVAGTELAATITLTDGDLIDFSSITPNTSSEGLKLTQSTDCSNQTAEGLICWDSDNEKLYVGNATGVTEINSSAGASTLQQAYEAGETISINSTEGALTMTATSANVNFSIGSGTDTGDFRIWDGTDNWFFIDESADTLVLGVAAGGGITIGGANMSSLTVTTDGTGNAEVSLPTGSISSAEILDGDILEVDLKAIDAPGDEECLTYEATGGDFEWQACGGGGGGTLDDAYNYGTATIVVDAYDVTWQLADDTNDYNFVIDNTTTGEIATAFGITTTGTGGTFVTAIDLSDAEIGTALAIGANDITTAASILASTELDILDSGIALSELTDSGTLTAGTVDINGGNIDGTTIGGAVPAAGTFTGLTVTTSALAVNSDSITADGATLTINAAGAVDIQDAVTVDSLITDVGGITILAGQAIVPSVAGSITIGSGSLTVFTVTTDGTGDTEVVLPNDSIGVAEINDTGDTPGDEECLTYEATGGKFEWQACGGGGGAWSDVTDPTGALTLSHAEYATTFNWNMATDVVKDGLTLTMTDDLVTDTSTQRLLVLNNLDDALSTGTLERFLVLDNKDTNEAVTTALEILASSTGTITTAVDLSDAEIGTALAIGANDITTAASTLASTELDILDSGIALSELTDSGTLTAGTVDINGGNIDGTTIGSAATSTGAFTTVSASGAIAANGGITFDNATDTLGAFTAAGNIDLNTSNLLVNIGAAGTDFSGTGGLTLADTLSVTSGGASITAGALAVNSDSITSDGALVINATSTVQLGDGTTNYFDFSETGGPTYHGTARPTKKVTIIPEFAGATLTPDGANNTGTMTSDFCSSPRSINAAATPTNSSPCDTDVSTEEHNYYTWTTAQAANQDYDIWVRWQVPSDFSGFDTLTDAVQVNGWKTDAAGTNEVQVSLYDTAGTADATNISVATGALAWTQTTVDTTPAGTYTTGSYATFKIHMAADQSDHVKVGEITISYKAKF